MVRLIMKRKLIPWISFNRLLVCLLGATVVYGINKVVAINNRSMGAQQNNRELPTTQTTLTVPATDDPSQEFRYRPANPTHQQPPPTINPDLKAQLQSHTGVVYPSHTLDRERASLFQNDVFLMYVRASTLDFFYNAMCSHRQKDYKYKIVAMTTDETTFASLTAAQFDGVIVQQASASLTDILDSVLQYLSAGINVVYAEPTVEFFRDPFAHLPTTADLVAQSGVPSLKHDHRLFGQWKFGFFRVKASPLTWMLFSDIRQGMQGVHTELAAHAPPPTMMQLVAVETLKLWETEGQAMVLSLDASTSEINRLLKDRGDILTVSYLNALEYVTADLYYKHRDIYNKIIAKRSEEGHVFTAVLAHADRPGVQAINKALIAKIGNWVLPLPRIAGTSQIAFDYTYGPITERVAIETFCTAALEDIVRDLPALDWEDTGDDAMEKEALEDESESAGDNADSDESADDEILPLSENAEMDNMAT